VQGLVTFKWGTMQVNFFSYWGFSLLENVFFFFVSLFLHVQYFLVHLIFSLGGRLIVKQRTEGCLFVFLSLKNTIWLMLGG